MSTVHWIASAVLALAMPATASAQAFPEGASVPSADEIRSRLGGNVFSVKLADGNSWRLEYKSNGYFFLNASTGFRGTGEWKSEDGKLCGQLRGREGACNEVWIHQGILYLQRTSGEMVQYIPK